MSPGSDQLKHCVLLPEWKQAMECGLIGGRPFSSRTVQDYLSYVSPIMEANVRLNIQVFKTALMTVPADRYATRDKTFKALVCFGKFLVEEGHLETAFLEQVKRYRPKRHIPPRRTAVESDDIDKLMACCDTHMEKVLITLMVKTGLRASELCDLKLDDLDLVTGILHVRLGKWGKSRRLGLCPDTVALLDTYIRMREPDMTSDYLFLNRFGQPMSRHGLHKRLQRIGEKAGVKVHSHALRRSFVTINANKGRPLQMLQIACGHSSIQTTRSYCLTTEEEVIAQMKSW